MRLTASQCGVQTPVQKIGAEFRLGWVPPLAQNIRMSSGNGSVSLRRNRIWRFVPLVFAVISLVWVVSFLRMHLIHTSDRFAEEFKRQNYSELTLKDVLTLTQRMNALSGAVPWVCLRLGTPERTFYSREQGRCTAGLWRERREIHGEGKDALSVQLTLTLSAELVRGAVVFVILQGLALVLFYWSSRRMERQRLEGEVALGRFAAQVAHDIRSPLGALKQIASRIEGQDPDTLSLLGGVIERIQGIAASLLSRHREIAGLATEVTPTDEVEVASLLRDLVREKRAEFSSATGIEIKGPEEAREFRVGVPRQEFLRVISNLFNNAVESFSGRASGGKVEILLGESGSEMEIEIRDNGCGMPAHVLAKLGKTPVSEGKKNGNGLGSIFVQERVTAWGGSICYDSRPGLGTSVKIRLSSRYRR